MKIFLKVEMLGGSSDYHSCTLSFAEWMDLRLLEKFFMSVVLDFFFSSSSDIKLNCL